MNDGMEIKAGRIQETEIRRVVKRMEGGGRNKKEKDGGKWVKNEWG